MRAFQSTLMLLTTSMFHLTITASDLRGLDAFGSTFKGAQCNDRYYPNPEIYANVNIACDGGKTNTNALINERSITARFEGYENSIRPKLRGLDLRQKLFLAPFYANAKTDTAALQEGDKLFTYGNHRLVLNERCDVLAIIKSTLAKNQRDEPYYAHEICDYKN